MRWLILVLSVLLTTGCAVEVNEHSFVDWAREEAVVLDASDWPATPPLDLSFLDDAVEAADVVFLGEPDHYVNEKYDYRLVMIRYLIEHGYRFIGMEMGFSDGLRVDQYLQTGEDQVLDTVGVYGNREQMRSDRQDLIDVFAALEVGPLLDPFALAEREFLRSLRELSVDAGEPLHWFGFDIDVYPGGAYQDVAAMLEPFDSDPAVSDFLSRLERVPLETRLEEVQRLKGALMDGLPGLIDTFGTELAGAVERSIDCLIESLLFLDLISQEPFSEKWTEGIRYRETVLLDRLDSGAWPVPPGEKAVLLGHNFHLNRDGSGLRPWPVEEQLPDIGYPSFGSGVAARHEVVALWMLYRHGTSAQVSLVDPYFEVADDATRLEHLLAEVGTVFILPVSDDDERSTYLRRDLNFVSNGSTASGVLGDQTDYIFYVDEVTAVGR